MKLFIIQFRYQKPGDKSAGPVQQYRLYAVDLAQAWEMARGYGNYEGIELINVVPA
ncbi:MAG: hypothetical protein V3T70_11530 [Phycisphaerae bacterium]